MDIKVRYKCGLGRVVGSNGGGEEILKSGCIWKMEYIGFTDGLYVGSGNNDESRIFGLSKGRMALP